jgi:ribosomal protein S8
MLTDPLSNLIACIKNGNCRGTATVLAPYTFENIVILDMLYKKGYITGYNRIAQNKVSILLKYYSTGEPVLQKIRHVSKPSQPTYIGAR